MLPISMSTRLCSRTSSGRSRLDTCRARTSSLDTTPRRQGDLDDDQACSIASARAELSAESDGGPGLGSENPILPEPSWRGLANHEVVFVGPEPLNLGEFAHPRCERRPHARRRRAPDKLLAQYRYLLLSGSVERRRFTDADGERRPLTVEQLLPEVAGLAVAARWDRSAPDRVVAHRHDGRDVYLLDCTELPPIDDLVDLNCPPPRPIR
jgi:hypothetical protein